MLGIIFILFILIPVIPIALIREKRYVRTHGSSANAKIRLWVLRILGCLVLAVIIAAGYFIYKIGYEKNEIDTYSKDEYLLAIDQIGATDFPFGQSYCRLTLSKDGKKIDDIDITVKNDGKTPDKDNFSIQWIPEGVSVIAHGEEQEDETYVLYYERNRMKVLDKPQVLNANFIEWVNDGMRVTVCDPKDNTIFPDGARLTVHFDQDTYFIDLDGSLIRFNPHRKLFEPKISRKLQWVEGMVLQIEFTDYRDFVEANGYKNRIVGLRIENVDVIAVDVD